MRTIPGFVFVLGTLFALALAPHAARAGDLLDQYAATDHFRSGQPRSAMPVPDGRHVLFLRSGPRDRSGVLFELDLATGTERTVATAAGLLAGGDETLTPEARARLERQRSSARGIASFELSRDGARVLVPLSGRLFVLERASGAARELSPGSPPAEDARLSPNGRRVACVREGDLCVIEIASGRERRVTAHAGERVSWGLAEFVAQEEMDRFEGWWWTDDSRALLVQCTDESRVEHLSIADPAHPEQPAQLWAYPRAGRENADVRLALFPADSGAGAWVDWDRARWPYLCAVVPPRVAGGTATLVVMDRAQQHEAVLDAAPGEPVVAPAHAPLAPGTPHARVRFEESDAAWLNLRPGVPHALGDGALLWIAERDDSGPWLERRDPAGAILRLTPPGLRVMELLHVDEPRGCAWVMATDDPRESHVWRVPLGGGTPRRMGRDEGLEAAAFAAAGSLHVRSLRPPEGAARWIVEDADGRVRGELRSLAEPPLASPRVEWLTVGADSMRACIVRPHDFDPRRRYPVIDWAYAGPHWPQVQHAAAPYVLAQWIADQGFVLVCVDGRGTPWRGRAWERAIRGDLIGPALADHEAGLRAVCARVPQLDPQRIGVVGWSFGGYYAVLAAERAPQTYRAAVAGAPVVDWRDYDTFYTERYLGLPSQDSLAYARSSALTDAAVLSRPLLVIHGTADDNVYFFHSLKLAGALDRAGRDWDFLPLPGQAHGPSDPAMVRQTWRRATDFLRQALGGPGDAAPPRP